MFKIKQSKNADTRTAVGEVTKQDLFDNSVNHICDVESLMQYCSEKIRLLGKRHDWTKIDCIDLFHSDFEKARGFGADFTALDWYKLHLREERHHLNDSCPEDVNLFDVIEMICDNVAAGLARSGKFRDVAISDEILQKAVKNTADLLVSKCEIVS